MTITRFLVAWAAAICLFGYLFCNAAALGNKKVPINSPEWGD